MSSYGSDDDEDYGYSSEEKWMPEMAARERVGLGQGYVGEVPKTRTERALMEPLDRFRQFVDAICRQLNNWDDINISEQSIDIMLERAAQLSAVEHKNPTGYVTGFIASNGGRNLQKQQFDYVLKKVLPHVEDNSIHSEDVIRYARLWLNIDSP